VLECHPDVIAKGADYTAATTVGAAEVISWGGRFEGDTTAARTLDQRAADALRR
jgi:bifunctional ADP-heptose synthase (sugar kinase/adenylyltransferase)